MVELDVFGRQEGLSVDEDLTVGNADALTGEPDHALHIVFAAVDGAVDALAEGGFIRQHAVAPVHRHQSVVVGVGDAAHHCVARREIEYHDVAGFHVAQPFEAMVRELRLLGVAFAQAEGELIVYQREIYRSHRHAGAVDGLVDKQVVARVEGLFKRGRGDLVVLPDEGEEEIDQNEGVDDSVDPRHDAAHHGDFRLLPEGEGDVAGDVDVEQEDAAQQQPPVAHPCHPKHKQNSYDRETDPARGFSGADAIGEIHNSLDNEGGGESCYPFGASGEAEMLRSGGFDGYAVGADAQVGGDVGYHLRDVGEHLGLLGYDGHVDVGDGVTLFGHELHAAAEQGARVGPFPFRVGVGEMIADIAQGGGAEDGVGQGVEGNVGVGVAE